MLDQNYIDELKSMENEKEAKAIFYEYTKTFGIRTYKNKSLDEMIKVFSSKLAELENEPMPENNTGLTISELIDADDEMEGRSQLSESEANPDAIFVLKGTIVEKPIVLEETENAPIEIKVVAPAPVRPIEMNVVITDNKIFELEKTFSPTIVLMGKAPGYYTLSWWIYQWILENEDWKENPNKCPHYHAIDILKSLIYYIKRDGSVMIRETRNSSFQTLK